MLICKYCGSERKNKNSLSNHERTCPQNTNRVYKNGMTGKKGRNQFTKAARLGLPKPKASKSLGMLGKRHDQAAREKISATRKELFDKGLLSGKNKIRYYEQNPSVVTNLYICEFRTSSEVFIKYGISEKGTARRFGTNEYAKYEITVLLEKEMNAFEAAQLEKRIRENCRALKYRPLEKFNGHTECLNRDAWDMIVTEIGFGA